LRASSAIAAPRAPPALGVVTTKAGPVSVRVVVVLVVLEVLVAGSVAVALVEVEVAVGPLGLVDVVEVEVLVAPWLVVVALWELVAVVFAATVRVTVFVVVDPQPASRAATARPTASVRAFGGVFIELCVRFPFAIHAGNGYRPPRRERERWPVEQRRCNGAALRIVAGLRSPACFC
jgi:hypothetical protein